MDAKRAPPTASKPPPVFQPDGMAGTPRESTVTMLPSMYSKRTLAKAMPVSDAVRLLEASRDSRMRDQWAEVYDGTTIIRPVFDVDDKLDEEMSAQDHDNTVRDTVSVFKALMSDIGYPETDCAVSSASRWVVDKKGVRRYKFSMHVVLPQLAITVDGCSDLARWMKNDIPGIDMNIYRDGGSLMRCTWCCKKGDENSVLKPLTTHPLDNFFITAVNDDLVRVTLPKHVKRPVAVAPPPTSSHAGSEETDIDAEQVASLMGMIHLKESDDVRSLWVDVGNYVKAAMGDGGFEAWHEWSSEQPGYSGELDCLKTWRSFNPTRCGNGIGAICNMAKKYSPDRYAAWREERRQLAFQQLQDYVSAEDSSPHDKAVFDAIATKSHYDVAVASVALLEGMYICVDVKGDGFYVCDNTGRWKQDGDSSLRKALSDKVSPLFSGKSKALYKKASSLKGDEAERVKGMAEDAAAVALSLKNCGFKDKVIKEFKALTYDPKFLTRLDADPYLLGFDNGVMELKTGVFRALKPDDYVSLSTGYNYVHEADPEKAAYIDGFFSSVLDTEIEDSDEPGLYDTSKRQYFMDYYSSQLAGVNRSEQVVLLVGAGRNGKGVSVNLINATFGEYSYQPNVGIIQKHANNPSAPCPELLKCMGMRVVNTSEPDEGTDLNLSKIKGFSGNDLIQARGMYARDTIEFKPMFGLSISLNKLPPLPSLGRSIKERFNFITFDKVFTADPRAINERKIDTSIKERLEGDVEYRQVFMHMLLNNWFGKDMASPSYQLHVPASVVEDNMEVFRTRDPVGVWLDTLAIDKDSVVNLSDAFAAFGRWLDDTEDFSSCRVEEDQFKEAMAQHNYRYKQHSFKIKGTGKTYVRRGFRGIRV